jgi:hypothetical protein
MADIKVTDDDLAELEQRAKIAYLSLRRVVEEEDFGNLQQIYVEDFGGKLLELMLPSHTRGVRYLNKGGRRAKRIEPYILQFVLLSDPLARKSKSYQLEVVEDPNDGMGGLKAYLDAEEPQGKRLPEEGQVFRSIQHKAAALRRAGKHDCILHALEYVREKNSQ